MIPVDANSSSSMGGEPSCPTPLRGLRDALAALRLDLELSDASAARSARDDIVGQTDDYLLPRLEQMDAPILMVVGGSTQARQVDDREQPRRRGGQPVQCPATDDPGAPSSCVIRTTFAGSRTTGSCPGCRASKRWSAEPGHAVPEARSTCCPRASRFSIPPTSTPCWRRTAPSRPSSSRRPTPGCS